MDEKKYAQMRFEALTKYAGGPIEPVNKSEELIGRWEMRYGGLAVQAGLVEADRVQRIYDFAANGTFSVGREKFLWKLEQENKTCFLVFAPNRRGAKFYGERLMAFKMTDGKLMFSNRDTSVVEILTRLPVKAAKRTKSRQRR